MLFFFCNRVLPQCALQVQGNVKFQVLKNGVWCRIFSRAFFSAFGHIISSGVRHFPMLLHLNNHEVHEFIILLRESSFWYFSLYALRTHSHYWLHFPPDLFPFNGMRRLCEPSLSKLLLLCWFLPVIFDVTAFVFHDSVVSLIPSVRFGASFCRDLEDGRRNYAQMYYLCFYQVSYSADESDSCILLYWYLRWFTL